MIDLVARSSKGQLKIQQMAFVLVAFMILLGFVAVFYLSIRFSSLKGDVEDIRHERAQELVRRLASTPEFAWTLDSCARCVDMDKVFSLKNQSSAYKGFWGEDLVYLRIQQLYPEVQERECIGGSYPDCSHITLFETRGEFSSDEAFVALCRLEGQPLYTRCTLGKIIMGVASP